MKATAHHAPSIAELITLCHGDIILDRNGEHVLSHLDTNGREYFVHVLRAGKAVFHGSYPIGAGGSTAIKVMARRQVVTA